MIGYNDNENIIYLLRGGHQHYKINAFQWGPLKIECKKYFNKKAMKIKNAIQIKTSLRQTCKNLFRFLIEIAVILTRRVHFIVHFLLTDIWPRQWW